jgi:hypothetical protein
VLENAAHSREMKKEEALQKANEERQRKKEAREKIKAEDPNLYELITLIRNHSRLIRQVNRSAKKMEKFVREKFEVEL